MGRIRVLPDVVIDRIAAGEVVERPASVVKELVENSLDAGAVSIAVTVEGGGKRLIRVADDGDGMDRDDALLALERHATSKLSAAEDLVAIPWLGFRGEALSSIAAVSVFRLSTATSDGAGTEIVCSGGTIESVGEAGLAKGTTVQVERLFYNVPARRKFLRTDSTELSHIVRLVSRFALAYPGVRFALDHGGQRLVDAEPVERLAERVGQIYGREFASKLLPFDRQSEGLRAHGFAGRPAEALPRRDGQHLFVNGRVVQDRTVSHAVMSAYGNTVPHGRYPALLLYLEVEPSQLDVNVHPRKDEVRFHRGRQVHDLVREAVRSTLSDAAVVPELSDLRPGEGYRQAVAEATLGYLAREGEGARPGPGAEPAVASGLIEAMQEPGRRAVPLAQYRDSYIVAAEREALILVDQHAAHERVLFERYLADAERNEVEVQRLMFPATIELAPHERVLLEEEAEEFRRLGFLIEPFGGETVRVSGVPRVAGGMDPADLLRELLGEAGRARSAASDLSGLRRRLVTTAACHAAIKVNHALGAEEMQRLLDDLFGTVNPSTCPHGRPAVFRLTTDEIERAFRRR